MNEAYDAIMNRRSVRAYSEKRVPKEILDKIALAGCYAPSAMGRQPGKLVVIQNKELIDRLELLNARVMGDESKKPFYGAQDLILVLVDKSVPSYLYDGALIMGNLMNAASALGVSSCWIHRAKEVFDSAEGKAILAELGIEGEWEGIGHCILGYRAGDEPQPKPRKDGFIVYA